MLRFVSTVSRIIGYCIFAYGMFLACFVQSFAGPDAQAASSVICLAALFIALPRFIGERMAKRGTS